jgi:hypothetical protein
MSIIHSITHGTKEHTTMGSTPLSAPYRMMQAPGGSDRFDDGLVHNHHWAVTADEAYPSQVHDGATDSRPPVSFAAVAVLPSESHGTPTHLYDSHDDGLVHNHEWAVTGK